MPITDIVIQHIKDAAKAYVAAIIPVFAAIALAITNVADIDVRAIAATVVAASIQWLGVYYTSNYKGSLEDLSGEVEA